MTAREIVLSVLASTPVRDLDFLVQKAQEKGADPTEARAAVRDLLSMAPDRPGFTSAIRK